MRHQCDLRSGISQRHVKKALPLNLPPNDGSIKRHVWQICQSLQVVLILRQRTPVKILRYRFSIRVTQFQFDEVNCRQIRRPLHSAETRSRTRRSRHIKVVLISDGTVEIVDREMSTRALEWYSQIIDDLHFTIALIQLNMNQL